jgi:phospholipase A1
MKLSTVAITATLILMASSTLAEETYQACLLEKLAIEDDSMTLGQVREACQAEQDKLEESVTQEDVQYTPIILGNISSRILRERQTQLNPYVLTPHKMNYTLPVLHTNRINTGAYESINGYEENLTDVEAKFQISLKVPLNTGDLLFEDDALYLGFTLEAWWQVHSENLSKPFRETNYQPELFYLAPLKWTPFNSNTGLLFGIEHQSNGRGLALSRSWNRVYAQFLFEKDNFSFSLRPWVRLKENERRFPLDVEGDDNPDIEDYMGRFELNAAYKWHNLEFTFTGRQNFSTNYGAAEFGLTFPLFGKVRGYATAFSGYGESLIDYNYSQTRFGLGISFNNIL